MAVDDQTPITLSPGVQEIAVPEGTHTIRLINAADATEVETEFEMTGGYFSRLFGSDTWLLNAGGAHVDETVYYSAGRIPPRSAIRGRLGIQKYSGLDHVFEDPPESIQAKENSGTITRRCVYELAADPATLVTSLELQGKTLVAMEIAQDYLPLFPEDRNLVGTYSRLAERNGKRDQAIATLLPMLQTQPPRVAIHLSYLRLNRDATEEQKMRNLYDEWLQESPNDPGLLMLRSSASTSVSEARKFAERAVKADPDLADASIRVTSLAHSVGDFETVQKEVAKLQRNAPERVDLSLTLLDHTARTAISGPKGALEHCLATSQEDVAYAGSALLKAESLQQLDRHQEAIEILSAGQKAAKNDGADAVSDFIFVYGREILGPTAETTLEPKASVRLTDSDQLQAEITRILNGADNAAASKLLQNPLPSEVGSFDRLSLSVLFRSAGKTEQADRLRVDAVEKMAARSIAGQKIADILTSDRPPTLSDVSELLVDLHDRVLILIDLSNHFPSVRDEFLEQADRLCVTNFDNGCFLRMMIDETR